MFLFLYLKDLPVFAIAYLWKSKKPDSHIRLGSK